MLVIFSSSEMKVSHIRDMLIEEGENIIDEHYMNKCIFND